MKQLEWVLSQWHAISASRAPLKINGVLYHDIYSILKTMMEKPEVKTWLTSLEVMFDHLSDYENPHEVTMEQLPTTVIEYLYSLWREQGYQGTLEFFRELLFTYITIIQFDDLFVDDNLYSEELIPSVRAVNLYIKKHNEDLNAHTVILERIFGNGNYHRAYPTYSGFRMYGDCTNSKHFDSEKKVYRNIPFLGEIAKTPQEYSVCVGFRFTDTDKDLCSIHSNDDASNYYTLGCSWSDKTVYLKKNDTRILEFHVDEYIADKYFFDSEKDIVLGCALIIDKYITRLAIVNLSSENEDATLYKVVADIRIGTGLHKPNNPRLGHISLDHSSELIGIATYAHAMTSKEIWGALKPLELQIHRTNREYIYLHCIDDAVDCQQDTAVIIPIANLTANDITGTGKISELEVIESCDGTATVSGSNVTFNPSVRFKEGNPHFRYKLIDTNGKTSRNIGRVDINVTMLPELNILIFDTITVHNFTKSYRPPTFADIFKSWSRYDAGDYYPPGTTPSGESAAWEMMSGDQFRCTVNSAKLTGFVSPDTFSDYDHMVDLSSTDGDDDAIMVIIAFKRIGNSNHSLLLTREAGGWTGHNGFSIVHVQDGNSATILKKATGPNASTGNPRPNMGLGWNKQGVTRVRVVRKNTHITAYAAPFKSTNLNAGEVIELDTQDYDIASWVNGKLPYGYACWSQKYSTFTNATFTGAGQTLADNVYDYCTGDIWAYSEDTHTWGKTGQKIWDVLGYPRYVTNPENGRRYLIENGRVTRCVLSVVDYIRDTE